MTWKYKYQFLDEICLELSLYTKYPTSAMYCDAARSIVDTYPYLKESIGSGYGGWKQALIDKMKNMRSTLRP